MKKLITTIILSSIFLVSAAFAGGSGHHHSHDSEPVLADEARENANTIIESLISKEKISSSWALVDTVSVEQKEFNGQMEWVVSYTNEEETDIEKQTLYIFLTLSGEYIAANYSGK